MPGPTRKLETSVQLATAKEPEGGASGNGTSEQRACSERVLPLAEVTHPLLRLLVEQRADIQMIERFLIMLREERAEQARLAFDGAMKQFKSAPPTITKNKHVKYPTKSGNPVDYWHATLDQACDQIIPALAAVGITHSWKVKQAAELITVSCVLKGFGHSEETQMQGLPDTSGDKSPLKALSSTVIILERYTLLAACGLAARGEDDETENNGKPGIASDEVEKNCAELAKAKDAAELKFLYTVAYEKAQEIGDKNAMARYIVANATRKKEFGLAGAR